MIEKVAEFPIEEYYFLESDDFLVDRAKFYFKKNKIIKLNSYWLGVSRLRVNNDKLLFLFNGLRGYYDVRTRYLKEPEIMENKVPLSKLVHVNDYLIKKYKYKNLLIFSLNLFNRPTIRLKKENNILYYSFPSRLAEYLNKKRELKTMVEANKQFSKTVKELKNIGFRFSIKNRKKSKGWRRLKYEPSIAVGITEIYLLQYLMYMQYAGREITKALKYTVTTKKNKNYNRYKWFQKFYKTPLALRLLFVVSKKYLSNKLNKVRRRRKKRKKGNKNGSNKNVLAKKKTKKFNRNIMRVKKLFAKSKQKLNKVNAKKGHLRKKI